MRLAVNGARAAAVALATGGLAGGLLVASTTAAHAVQNVDADQDFTCDVNAFPEGQPTFPLGDNVITVTTKAVLPDTYTPGQTIPGQQVQIDLTLPESLRSSTYNALGGRSADGSSDDTRLGLKNSGQTSPVPILNLQAAETPIPDNNDPDPWVVPATGQVPPVPVPAQASGPTQVLTPTAFTVDSTIYDEQDNAIPATLDCVIVDDSTGYRRLGVIQQDGQEPAGESPVAGDVSVKTAPGKAVGVTLPDATDSDSPATELGYQVDGAPADGRLTGAGQDLRYIPDDGFVGTDSFGYTVTDQTGNTDTGTVTVQVAKAASTTKVSAPKRSKAGKPVTMKVSVQSNPAATGKATVKLGAKTLDTANVKNGKATLTVPGKSTKKLKGAKTFTVTYGGSDAVKGSSAKVKVTFTK